VIRYVGHLAKADVDVSTEHSTSQRWNYESRLKHEVSSNFLHSLEHAPLEVSGTATCYIMLNYILHTCTFDVAVFFSNRCAVFLMVLYS